MNAPAGKKKTLLTILGIMAAMATLGLTFALNTVDRRRKNDLPPLPKHHHPAELRVLGHVPANCSVIGALHLREMRFDDAMLPLLKAPRPPAIEAVLGALERRTGLPQTAFDYVALGAMDPEGTPIVYLLVQTAQRFDPNALVRKAGDPDSHRGKPMARFELEGGGTGRLWAFSERTFAFVLRPDEGPAADLDAIPLTPRGVLEGSPAPLRQAILHRLDGRSLAWIAGQTGPAPATWLPLLGGSSAMAQFPAAVFAIGLFPQEQLAAVGQAFGGDAERVKKLDEALLAVRLPGDLTLKTAVPPPEAKDADQWLSFQIRGTEAAIREWLKAP